jgi:hypothetical protein
LIPTNDFFQVLYASKEYEGLLSATCCTQSASTRIPFVRRIITWSLFWTVGIFSGVNSFFFRLGGAALKSRGIVTSMIVQILFGRLAWRTTESSSRGSTRATLTKVLANGVLYIEEVLLAGPRHC